MVGAIDQRFQAQRDKSVDAQVIATGLAENTQRNPCDICSLHQCIKVTSRGQESSRVLAEGLGNSLNAFNPDTYTACGRHLRCREGYSSRANVMDRSQESVVASR